MRRLAVFVMAMLAVLSALAAAAEGRQIVAQTEVTKWGQLPTSFEISGQTLPEGVTPQDFAITGEATAWGASSLHPFACGVQAVEATEEGWRLVPEQFPDKYFYVKQLAIACEGHPELGFTLADIGQTQTAVADDFEPLDDPEHQLTAHVFLPEVAAALGAKCILPDHAEIGNAIGAVMAELIARASVSVTQWDEGGITYLVHTPEGSVKFRNVGDALALAKKTAAELAVREAHLRGARGELTPKIFLQGNTHNGRGADSLAYGGTVTAEVRYSHLK